jgi:hypothetical protein
MALLYLLPVALLFTRDPRLAVLGGTTYILMLIAYLPMVRFYGLGIGWALTLPLSAIFYMSATVHSAIRFWGGRGGDWKGRSQDQSATL